MRLTFIKKSTGQKTTREIEFIERVADSVNKEKDLFFFIDCKDRKFKSCKIAKIVKTETDFKINKMIKL